jgi:hypothetical protein
MQSRADEMRPRRGRWVLSALVAMVAACSTNPDPTDPDDDGEAVIYLTEHFRIRDEAGSSQALIDSLGAYLEREYVRVRDFLPEFTAPDTIRVTIEAGEGLSTVSLGEPRMTQYAGNLNFDYFTHQLTHMMTGYAQRPFLEEGLAVYVTEQLLPDNRTVDPYRGQPTHAWMSLYGLNDSYISLFTAYRANDFDFDLSGSSADASAWQLFVQAGSFTRWVFEEYGRETWMDLYRTDDLGLSLGGSTSELQQRWIQAARAAFPAPLACEDALAPLDPREEFWCARAAGN